MASTGEVASFGKDVHEAYWAALLSVNGFKLPRPHSGILLGGDINRPEMAVVAANLMRLGFHLYTHCTYAKVIPRLCLADQPAPEVTAHINDQPYLSIKRILVPVKDKRKLREGWSSMGLQGQKLTCCVVLEDHEISCVINVSRSRAPDTNDADYASRRAAVDFGIPVSCSTHKETATG